MIDPDATARQCPRCGGPCWLWHGRARCRSVTCMWMEEDGDVPLPDLPRQVLR